MEIKENIIKEKKRENKENVDKEEVKDENKENIKEEHKDDIDETRLFERIKKTLDAYKSYIIQLNHNNKIYVSKNSEDKKDTYKSYIENITFFMIDNSLHTRYSCITEINKFLIMNYYYSEIIPVDDFDSILRSQIERINNLLVCPKCYRLNDKSVIECSCMLGEIIEEDGLIIKKILNLSSNLDECAICLSKLKSKFDSVCFTQCEKPHYFHLECLSKSEKSECPICKVHCHTLLYRNIKISYKCKISHSHLEDVNIVVEENGEDDIEEIDIE